jgi:hypothetical protein
MLKLFVELNVFVELNAMASLLISEKYPKNVS